MMERRWPAMSHPGRPFWRRLGGLIGVAVWLLVATAQCRQAPPAPTDERSRVETPSAQRLDAVRARIKRGWRSLTRSHADRLAAVRDEKVPHTEGTPFIESFGLSRYHGLGRGPAPEVVTSVVDAAGLTHDASPGSTPRTASDRLASISFTMPPCASTRCSTGWKPSSWQVHQARPATVTVKCDIVHTQPQALVE